MSNYSRGFVEGEHVIVKPLITAEKQLLQAVDRIKYEATRWIKLTPDTVPTDIVIGTVAIGECILINYGIIQQYPGKNTFSISSAPNKIYPVTHYMPYPTKEDLE